MLAGLLEYYNLAGKNQIFPQKVTGIIAGSVMFFIPALVALEVIPFTFLAFLPLMIIVFFVSEFFRDNPDTLSNLAFSIFPVVYIAIPLAMLIFLTSRLVTGGNPHWHLAFGFFIILWSDDTFAYLTGILIGKHKLFEKISPKKTWEGSFGGLAFGILAAYVLSLFFTELTVMQWIGAALIIAVTGTLGDLSESLLKRKFNVKDSGTLLPGHGGILDRFDSVLFSAPALFSYLLFLNP
jgi:phosphatidate cytidylyltransferase